MAFDNNESRRISIGMGETEDNFEEQRLVAAEEESDDDPFQLKQWLGQYQWGLIQ